MKTPLTEEAGTSPHQAAERPHMKRRAKAPTPGDYRLQGIAAALGELAGAHLEPDLAHMVLDSLGLTVDQLRQAGADTYDLKLLGKDA